MENDHRALKVCNGIIVSSNMLRSSPNPKFVVYYEGEMHEIGSKFYLD